MKAAEKILTATAPPNSPPIPLLRNSKSTIPSIEIKDNRRAAKLKSAVDRSPMSKLESE